MKMNKTFIAMALIGMTAGSVQAASEAQAIASWKATATKDSTDQALVVTPLGSLEFQYAPGIKGFNTVSGMFDIAIKGNAGTVEDPITGFTLKAKKINGTLSNATGDANVEVGVQWQGQSIAKDAYTTLIDTKAGVNGAGLSAVGAGFKSDASAQSSFNFNVTSATNNGAAVALDALPDGQYQGNVDVEFVANWA